MRDNAGDQSHVRADITVMAHFRQRSAASSHFSKTGAAVDSSVGGRLKRNERFLAALCADSGKHFLFRLFFVCSAAVSALFGLILEALLDIKLLLACRENEIVSAFLALQCDVLVHFGFTSL